VTGVATTTEIGTKMIAGAGEIIQGVVQQKKMAIGLLAEGKETAAMEELLRGGSSEAAVVTTSVIVTVHQEAKGMNHATAGVMDGAENAMGHSGIVVTARDTAAGVEMHATGALRMAVLLAMFVGKRVAVAARSSMQGALSGPRKWTTV